MPHGNSPKHAFPEALAVLEGLVVLGPKVVLMNPKNWDEREGIAALAFLELCC